MAPCCHLIDTLIQCSLHDHHTNMHIMIYTIYACLHKTTLYMMIDPREASGPGRQKPAKNAPNTPSDGRGEGASSGLDQGRKQGKNPLKTPNFRPFTGVRGPRAFTKTWGDPRGGVRFLERRRRGRRGPLTHKIHYVN